LEGFQERIRPSFGRSGSPLNGVTANLGKWLQHFFTLCYGDDASKIHKKLEEKFPKYRVFSRTLDNYGVTSKS